MTVQADFTPVQVTLTTGTDVITVPNYVLEEDELLVIRTRSGVNTTLTLNTDYTVTGEGDEAGCTVTMVGQAAADTITIYRDMNFTQENDLLDGEKRSGPQTEKVYDRLTMQNQQLKEVTNRSIRLPRGEDPGNSGELPDVDTRKGKVLVFDSTTGLPSVANQSAALGLTSAARQYGTVASMTSDTAITAVANGQAILLRGYYADGDFGNPIYLIVEAGTGGIKSFTLDDGRYANIYSDFALLAWYGAKGDGTTDDTTALQAAFDSGAKLVKGYPGKTYIALNLSFTTVGGTLDLNGSTWKTKSTATTGDYLIQFTGAGITVKNGTIDGNKANITDPAVWNRAMTLGGLRLTGDCSDFTIENCTVQNHVRTQISNSKISGGISGFRAVNNRFKVADAESIFLSGGTTADGATGVEVAGSARGILIANNSFYDTYGIGINRDLASDAYYPQEIHITGNRMVKSTSVYVRAIKAIITDNYIDLENDLGANPNATSYGYHLGITYDNASEGIVCNNVVRGFGGIGIEIGSPEDSATNTGLRENHPCIVQNNQLTYTADDGVSISGISYQDHHYGGIISDNILEDCYLRLYGTAADYTDTVIDTTNRDKNLQSLSITGNVFTFRNTDGATQSPITVILGLVENVNISNNICSMTQGASYSASTVNQCFLKVDSVATVRNVVLENNQLDEVAYISTYAGRRNISVGDSTTQFDVAYDSGATAWTTATTYLFGAVVLESSISYICIRPHYSGTFATDLAAGKWVKLFRYTYDAAGTDPGISATTFPENTHVTIASTNLAAGNQGTFIVRRSGANYFDVANASGVEETNKTLGAGTLRISPRSGSVNGGHVTVRNNTVTGSNFTAIFRAFTGASTMENCGYFYAEGNSTPSSSPSYDSNKYVFGPTNWTAVTTAGGDEAVTEYPGWVHLESGNTGNSQSAMARLPFDWSGVKGGVNVFPIGGGMSFKVKIDTDGLLSSPVDDMARIVFGKAFNAAIGLSTERSFGFEIHGGRQVYGFYNDAGTIKYVNLNTTLGNTTYEFEVNNVGSISAATLHFLIDGEVKASLFDVETSSTNTTGAGISIETANKSAGGGAVNREIKFSDIIIQDWSAA